MQNSTEYVHWIALLVVAGVAAFFLNAAIEGLVLDIEPESQVAAVFSAGKIVGVSDERVLVAFKDGVSEENKGQFAKKYGLKERGFIPQLGVHQFEIRAGDKAETIVKKLTAEPEGIDFAEPDYLIEPSVVPNDPWYVNWQKNKEQEKAPAAWDVSVGSASVIVAVADTGVNCTHEDLQSNCLESTNSDVQGHGTAVAGVIGAVGNNGVGVAGSSWGTKLMPLVVSNSAGAASYSAIASAVTEAADRGARVVNNSYQSGGSSAVQRAAKYLWGKGGVLVVSEGNYGSNTGTAANPYIVSVGAVDANGALYSWSSYGADVDVVAPGCTGATTALGGGYGSFCGTSSSAAEVSGLLALIFSVNPSLQPSDAVSILTSTVQDLGSPGTDNKYGAGLIDMGAAVQMAQIFVPSEPVTNPASKPGKRK
jgi:thermitase